MKLIWKINFRDHWKKSKTEDFFENQWKIPDFDGFSSFRKIIKNGFLEHIKVPPRSLNHKFQVFEKISTKTQFLNIFYYISTYTLKMVKKCTSFSIGFRKKMVKKMFGPKIIKTLENILEQFKQIKFACIHL